MAPQINQRIGQSQVTQYVRTGDLPIRHVSFAQFAANKQLEDTYQELYFEVGGNFRPRAPPDNTPAWLRAVYGVGQWIPGFGKSSSGAATVTTVAPTPAAVEQAGVSNGAVSPPSSQHLLVGVFDGHSGKHASHWLVSCFFPAPFCLVVKTACRMCELVCGTPLHSKANRCLDHRSHPPSHPIPFLFLQSVSMLDRLVPNAQKNFLFDLLLYRWHQAAQCSPEALSNGPLWSPAAFVEADNLFLDLKWHQNKVRHGLSGACYAVSHVSKW